MKHSKINEAFYHRYDDLSMPQKQLELAWLASLWGELGRNRNKHGLLGLDRSMFQRPEFFDLGVLSLRSSAEDNSELSDAILKKFMELRLISSLESILNEIQAIPALYPNYAKEIEKRAHFL